MSTISETDPAHQSTIGNHEQEQPQPAGAASIIAEVATGDASTDIAAVTNTTISSVSDVAPQVAAPSVAESPTLPAAEAAALNPATANATHMDIDSAVSTINDMHNAAIQTTRSGRTRRAPAAYTPSVPPERNSVEIESGVGTALSNIPNVVARLDKTKTDALELKRFFALCFPSVRTGALKAKNKQQLKSFNGLVSDAAKESARSKIRRFIKEDKQKDVEKIYALMDLQYSVSESIDQRVEEAMKFLINPQATGMSPVAVKSSSTKSKSSSSKRKSTSADGDSPKKKRRTSSTGENTLRTANSFVVFSSAKRDEVRSLHPDLSVQEITKKIAEIWRALGKEDKEVYELAAKKLREDAREEDEQRRKAEKKQQKKKRESKKKSKAPAAESSSKSVRSDSDSSRDTSGSDADAVTEDEGETAVNGAAP